MKKLIAVIAATLLTLTSCAPDPKNGGLCEVSDCDPNDTETALYCMEHGKYRAYSCPGGCAYVSTEVTSTGILCDPRGVEPGDRCAPPVGRERTCTSRREIVECVNGLWQLMETCEGPCYVNSAGVGARCGAK